MAVVAALLLAALPHCSAGPNVLLVSNMPLVEGWHWAYAASQALTTVAKGTDVKIFFLSPQAPPSSGKSGIQYVNSLIAAQWSAAVTEQKVAGFLSGTTIDLVLSLEVSMSSAVSAFPDTRFVSFFLGSHDTLSGSNRNQRVTMSGAKGAYLTGTLAGIQAIKLGRQVDMLTLPDLTVRDKAFLQGVMDVNAQTAGALADLPGRPFISDKVCVRRKTIGNPPDPTQPASSSLWKQAERMAQQSVDNGTDVIYAALGSYNEAVLPVVQQAVDGHYAVSAVIGVTVGILNANVSLPDMTSAVLARPVFPWSDLISGAIAGALDDWDDQSTWVAPWMEAKHKPTPSVAQHILSSACVHSSDATSSTEPEADTVLGVMRHTNFLLNGNSTDPPEVSQLNIGNPVKGTDPPYPCLGSEARNQNLSAATQPCVPKLNGNVRLVGVGVYLNAVGSVDMNDGSVYIDANLYLHQHISQFLTPAEAESTITDGVCDPALFQENTWFPYINASEKDYQNKLYISSMDNSETVAAVTELNTRQVSYLRLQGNHLFDPMVRHFPFDRQELRIVLEESAQSTIENRTVVFCHMPHYSGMSPAARFFPGQSFTEGRQEWAASVSVNCWPSFEHPYQYLVEGCENDVAVPWDVPGAELSCTCLGGTRASSRYTWTLTFFRPSTTAFTKIFLPPLTMTLVNEGVWLIKPWSYAKRLSICGSSMVSIVLFHSSVNNYLPNTSQFTTADEYLFIVYFSNLVVFAVVFIESTFIQAHYVSIALSIHRFTRIWGFMSTVASFLGFLVLWDFGPGWLILWVMGAHFVCFLITKLLWPVRVWLGRIVGGKHRRAEALAVQRSVANTRNRRARLQRYAQAADDDFGVIAEDDEVAMILPQIPPDRAPTPPPRDRALTPPMASSVSFRRNSGGQRMPPDDHLDEEVELLPNDYLQSTDPNANIELDDLPVPSPANSPMQLRQRTSANFEEAE
ncbi:hypothetical protein DIPPA_11419 [Diplonema papillatum]|nr:hypothetical protein DIPPA_11419 [Diplonema papillatum]